MLRVTKTNADEDADTTQLGKKKETVNTETRWWSQYRGQNPERQPVVYKGILNLSYDFISTLNLLYKAYKIIWSGRVLSVSSVIMKKVIERYTFRKQKKVGWLRYVKRICVVSVTPPPFKNLFLNFSLFFFSFCKISSDTWCKFISKPSVSTRLTWFGAWPP